MKNRLLLYIPDTDNLFTAELGEEYMLSDKSINTISKLEIDNNIKVLATQPSLSINNI